MKIPLSIVVSEAFALKNILFSTITDSVWKCSASRLSSTSQLMGQEKFFVLRFLWQCYIGFRSSRSEHKGLEFDKARSWSKLDGSWIQLHFLRPFTRPHKTFYHFQKNFYTKSPLTFFRQPSIFRIHNYTTASMAQNSVQLIASFTCIWISKKDLFSLFNCYLRK